MVLQTLATTHAYDESLPSVLSVLERLVVDFQDIRQRPVVRQEGDDRLVRAVGVLLAATSK
jgi:hypothetical protein